MSNQAKLLYAYDTQLRAEAETPDAVSVSQLRPLRLAVLPVGAGFVTYPPPSPYEAAFMAGLVRPVVDYFLRNGHIAEIEWRTRGHDAITGLHEALLNNGFEPGPAEPIMLGRAELLVTDVELPGGVAIVRAHDGADVRAACAMQASVFGSPVAEERATATVARAAKGTTEVWLAQAGEDVVGAGRVDFVEGTSFSGIWGGAVVPEWRGQGIYRALCPDDFFRGQPAKSPNYRALTVA